MSDDTYALLPFGIDFIQLILDPDQRFIIVISFVRIKCGIGVDIDADKINQRLDFLSRLMVKYGSTEEEMLDFLSSAQTELEKITLSDVLEVIDLSFDIDRASTATVGNKRSAIRIK